MSKVDAGSRRRAILFVGAVPPPVDGKAVATAAILQRLRRRRPGGTRIVDVTLTLSRPDRAYRAVRKLLWSLVMLFRALRLWSAGTETTVYLVADGGSGVYLNAVQLALLRPLVRQVFVHHHGFKWMTTRDRLLQRTVFTRRGAHVVQCETMGRHLQATYNGVATRTLSNAFHVEAPAAVPDARRDGILRLAHLGDLSIEKGLDTVCRTFLRLRAEGHDVQLRLGGEARDGTACACLDNLLAQCPDVEVVGFITPENKERFFRGVDVFLFPSVYPLETEGIVTLEALAHGVPVVAFDQCCLATNLVAPSGLAVGRREDFVSSATARIKAWQADPHALAAAKTHAIQRFSELKRQSEAELDLLLEEVGAFNAS